ncbi:CapA family protein [Peribacillus frigoritolerans]|uniref:CapA family protein n=1 Tax=Peribacillus frigoritolerans TaxID=450367 RepID=UPI002B056A2A|nr:CapA family protein [Peribacillus frigoritolerans]MEA3573927.1 CapA family protein [Peribacillus frigoritolerans]
MSKLLFLGDFLYDYSSINKDIIEIAEWIKKNDYSVILNFEAPLTNNGNKIKKRGPNLFHSKVAIDILKNMNVVGVCLSNNHMMDYGEHSLRDTLELLDKNNILHTGAGLSLEESIKPMEFIIDGYRIIVQNFGWDVEETVYATEQNAGCSPRDESLILKQTSKLRKEDKEAIIINIFHWGFEYNLYPMPFDIDLAHKSIDVGSNLIIGHHPHNIQPFESFKGKGIFYSLGNFYFGSRRSNFSKKKMNCSIENMCDYGLAVIYDPKNNKTDTVFIKYDQENNESRVLAADSNNPKIYLDNITGVDYKSAEYEETVKSGSSNINPILTLDRVSNELKLKLLYDFYKKNRLKGSVKLLLLKIPFLKKIVNLLKSRVWKNT